MFCLPPGMERLCMMGFSGIIVVSLTTGEAQADSWTLRQVRDEIADTTDTTALRSFPIAGGGQIEVEASCDTGSLDFDFTYLNKAVTQSEGPALLWNTDADTPYVSVRTRLDQGDIVTVPSQTDFRNVASVFFYDTEGLWLRLQRSVDGGAARPSPLGGSDASRKAFTNAIGRFALALGFPSLIERGAGSVEDFNSTAVFRAEIPLSDGRKAVATIERNDPVFQAFLKSCRAKGLQALDYDRSHPRPTCVAGEKLYVREGAVALKPDSADVNDLGFDGGELITVERPTTGIPQTLCRVAVPKLNGDTIVASVSRSSLQTKAEWDVDHASDIDKTWSGTIEGFEPTLRRLMGKYAGELAIDPSRYEPDIAEVTKIARVCAGIRQSALKRDYTGRTKLQLTPEQAVCRRLVVVVANNLGRPVREEPRSLAIWPRLDKLQDGRGGVAVTITVAPKADDQHRGDDFHRFGIIRAEFPPLP